MNHALGNLVVPFFATPDSSWITGWAFRNRTLTLWTDTVEKMHYRFCGDEVRDAMSVVRRLMSGTSPGKIYNDFVKGNHRNWLRVNEDGTLFYGGANAPGKLGAFTVRFPSSRPEWISFGSPKVTVKREDLPVTGGPIANLEREVRKLTRELEASRTQADDRNERLWAAIRDLYRPPLVRGRS
jgi:hypothetical protein